MDSMIIVAIIGAIGAIIAAFIGKEKKSNSSDKTENKDIKISQTTTGNKNTLIGIQINHTKEDDNHE